MNNETKVTGDHNIIIQDVNESQIFVTVDGKEKEILNKLDAFEALLKELKVETFQTADKIYNINSINEANFNFVTGKRSFNEHLTKSLMEEMSNFKENVKGFLEEVSDIPGWESKEEYNSGAKTIIINSFVGVIGVELRKLMAIGKESFSENKQHNYIDKCLYIVKRSLDLVCFAVLSRFWDLQVQKSIQLTAAHQKVLKNFFDSNFDLSIEKQTNLLKALLEVFQENELELPLSELKSFQEKMQESKSFQQTCVGLNELKNTFDKGQFTLLDCFEAESLLAAFLKEFSFLANYRMASIQEIGYREIRNATPRYIHRYMSINGKHNTSHKSAERINYTEESVHSDTVLMYKGDNYKDNIDLFPFVIDYNSLTLRGGVKIYFYCSQNRADDSLRYVALDWEKKEKEEKDANFLLIGYRGNLEPQNNLSELMMDENKRKEINLDIVVKQFHEARKCILGETSDPN